jgi:hypothetical protein
MVGILIREELVGLNPCHQAANVTAKSTPLARLATPPEKLS